jgi:hypothetical protein
MRRGRLAHRLRHPAEVFRSERHPSERIVVAGIEPASDEDQFGPEDVERGQHDPVEGQAIGAAATARRQRHVDRRALPLAASGLLQAAMDRLRHPREVVLLMQRDR